MEAYWNELPGLQICFLSLLGTWENMKCSGLLGASLRCSELALWYSPYSSSPLFFRGPGCSAPLSGKTKDSQAAGGTSHLLVNCYHDLGLIISVPLKYRIVNINMPRWRKLRVCIIVAKFKTHLNMQDGIVAQENCVRKWIICCWSNSTCTG